MSNTVDIPSCIDIISYLQILFETALLAQAWPFLFNLWNSLLTIRPTMMILLMIPTPAHHLTVIILNLAIAIPVPVRLK
jgi:hypothetical protein